MGVVERGRRMFMIEVLDVELEEHTERHEKKREERQVFLREIGETKGGEEKRESRAKGGEE